MRAEVAIWRKRTPARNSPGAEPSRCSGCGHHRDPRRRAEDTRHAPRPVSATPRRSRAGAVGGRRSTPPVPPRSLVRRPDRPARGRRSRHPESRWAPRTNSVRSLVRRGPVAANDHHRDCKRPNPGQGAGGPSCSQHPRSVGPFHLACLSCAGHRPGPRSVSDPGIDQGTPASFARGCTGASGLILAGAGLDTTPTPRRFRDSGSIAGSSVR